MSTKEDGQRNVVVQFVEKIVRIVVQPVYKFMATHLQPHADEVLCMMLLATEKGRELFPNIFPEGEVDLKKVKFVDRNKINPTKTNASWLFVGCGGGEFDEHNHPRAFYESASTLLARYLGFLDGENGNCPWWEKIIEDIRREDREGGAIPGQISYVIKSLYVSHGGTPEGDTEVIRWGITALEAERRYFFEKWAALKKAISNPARRRDVWYQELERMGPLTTKTAKIYLKEQESPDLEWFSTLASETLAHETAMRKEAKEHFLQQARVYPCEVKDGRKIKIYTVESDNREMSTVVWGFSGDIVVIRNKGTGHTAIMNRRDLGLSLERVHGELLRSETQKGAEWFMPVHKAKILNGSPRFPAVKPSGLSLDEIACIITRTLGRETGEKGGLAGLNFAFREFEEKFGSSVEEALAQAQSGDGKPKGKK